MGGIGSGRHWCWGAKDSTDDYRSIDVRRWKRDGLLTPHQSFAWQWSSRGEVVASIRVRTEPNQVILTYRHRSGGEDWTDESYPIYLDWTPCSLGGERPWFLCPAVGCEKRVAILYGGAIFACRHCHDLAYGSCRESYGDRATRKAERIRKKLEWEPGILNPGSGKPKGMHWKTFDRLLNKHHQLRESAIQEIDEKMRLLDAVLENN